MLRSVFGVLLHSLLLLSCGRSACAQDLAQNITLEHWNGEYPVAELHRFPKDHEIGGVGYIANKETWESVWNGWGLESVPSVDFPNEIVIYARNVDFLNMISPLSASLSAQGTVEVLAATTRTAHRIEDFVFWSAATIPSEGVSQLAGGGQILAVQVPEPTSMLLAAIGALGFVASRRKRQDRVSWFNGTPPNSPVSRCVSTAATTLTQRRTR